MVWPTASRPAEFRFKKIELISGCITPGDGQFHLTVDGVGQAGADHRFGSHPCKRPDSFREPHVVADDQADPPCARNIENDEIIPGCYTLLIRQERVLLTVAGDHLALRIDHRGRVVNVLAPAFENTSRYQPKVILQSGFPETVLYFPRHADRQAGAGTKSAQLGQNDQLDPWETLFDQGYLFLDEREVVFYTQLELQSSHRQVSHSILQSHPETHNNYALIEQGIPERFRHIGPD
jgi:hypothetical protein